MMAENRILAEVEGAIGLFTINNADKRNCMSLDMWRCMGDVFETWRDDQRVRAVIVRGAGNKCFSSGNDISEFARLRSTPEEIADYSNITERAYTFLKTFPKPTIARIAGYCIGGGLEISQLCDIQIASESATFGITPAKLGLGYKFEDVSLLTENIPSKVAKELLFTGRQFPASDALRWGLVNRVVQDNELDNTVECYAKEIAANAPLSIKASKYVIGEAVKEASMRNLSACQDMINACHESEDYLEGQKAFKEKRQPKFRGA